MIIKSDRIATASSAKRLLAHLFHGVENDEITVLQGGERDILDAWSDARRHGAVRAVRVWIVSPHEAMTREHLFDLLKDLAREFGFDSDRATVVEHAKPRVTMAHDRHWHIAVAEVDPASGRVLSSSHDGRGTSTSLASSNIGSAIPSRWARTRRRCWRACGLRADRQLPMPSMRH